jgi:hypothetical protein
MTFVAELNIKRDEVVMNAGITVASSYGTLQILDGESPLVVLSLFILCTF